MNKREESIDRIKVLKKVGKNKKLKQFYVKSKQIDTKGIKVINQIKS